MRPQRAVVGVLILLSLFPQLVAQEQQEVQPYFSLTSERTYLPGDKVEIAVYSHNVSELQFRVYRVNDPVKFFSQLQEMHGFGGKRRACLSSRAHGSSVSTRGSIVFGRGSAISFVRSSRPTRVTGFACGAWGRISRRPKVLKLTSTRRCRSLTSSK